MDKKTLKKYKPNKDRLIRIENQIQELCERESTVVMGKVTIDDPEIKEIFELHYLEGKTQQKVADEIGYTQARVSQIISGQLKDL